MSGRKLHFDGWVLDAESGDLERAGVRIRLQEQPALVLSELLAHAGNVVTREHLIGVLWPKGVVDYDTGLNTAVRKLRSALGDTAGAPRYIETLPRRGYRFIARVDPAPEAAAASQSTGSDPTPTEHRAGRRLVWVLGAGLGLLALLASASQLWRLSSRSSPAAVRVEAPAWAQLPQRTLVVLPFENLSADANDAFLATGLAEGVRHRLAGTSSLAVIARASSRMLRAGAADAREIGRRVNAGYLVEGSVQRTGDRLRVTAQLIDASDGSELWSLRFDRHMGNLLELEDEISSKVADALAVSLASGPGRDALGGTHDVDAYLAFIEARSLLYTYRLADAEKAVRLLERATHADPSFAAAYVLEARAMNRRVSLRTPASAAPGEDARILALIEKGLALDPQLGSGWIERAVMHTAKTDGYDESIDAEFRKGLTLAPNDAYGYEQYAEWLEQAGHVSEALAMIDRARQLDPLAPRSHYIKALILLHQRGDEQGARALLLEALRASPTYHPAFARLADLEEKRGHYAEAARLLEKAIALAPRADWIRWKAAGVYLDLEDVEAARDVVRSSGIDEGDPLCVAPYAGQARRVAAVVAGLPRAVFDAWLRDAPGCLSTVMRDEARTVQDDQRALRALEPCISADWRAVASSPAGAPRIICATRYASLLMSTGDRDRASSLLRGVLAAMQERTEFSSGALARVKAGVLATLGDTEGALTALEASASAQQWWFQLDHWRELDALHANRRFEAVLKRMHENAARQSTLVAAMRRSGEVPWRPGPQAP